jgi:hypothetical protein
VEEAAALPARLVGVGPEAEAGRLEHPLIDLSGGWLPTALPLPSPLMRYVG